MTITFRVHKLVFRTVVFWVDATGQHGLAAWPQDEAGLLNWYLASETVDAHGLGWRLPTKHELNLLFLQKVVVGGFSGGYFWSTSGFGGGAVWIQNFGHIERDANSVRAVRTF